MSPISLPESARASRKTHSNIDTGHTLFQSRFRSSATQARDAGLVTPETEGGPSQTSNTRRPHPLEFSQKRQEKANHEQLSSPEIHSGLEEVDFPLSRPEHSLLAEHRTELSLQDFSNDARDGLIDVDGSVLSQDQTFDSFASTKNSESMPRRGRLAIQNGVEQDGSLPSPRLSPVAVPSAQQLDNSFDSAEDQGTETDASGELTKYQPCHGDNLSEQRQLKEQAMSLLDMPAMLGYFESMPEKMQVYMMYQMLRRCPKPTLHFVADVVNPALKCDFLALLPPELSLSIVQHFDFRTMCRAAQVSKKWRHIVNSDEKTWKKLFEQDGFILPEGELQRAIEEGWGWQYPNGDEDYEKDLRLAIPSSLENESLQASSMSHWTDASGFTPFSSRRLKRKATMKSPLRRVSKRRSIMSSPSSTYKSVQTIGNASIKESPYAAANAAAMAIPYPAVGLPSLHNLHLFKSLYQRHYSIKNNWMRGDAKPMHIAFRAHTHHVVTCLQFDTDKILTGSDDTNINVYDTDNGALRATLRGHEGGVWALEYHGNTLVSGSTDRSVRVWDIERAECTQVFQGHTSTVRCLQILLPVKIGEYPDGTPEMIPKEPLIITGSRDSSLRVWKLPQAGDPKYFQHTSGHNPYFVRVLTGHQHSVRAIAAYADTLVSGSYDCTVRVWKISTGEPLHRLEGHSLKVYSVVLDHKRNRCISGSMDNQVKIWSLETGTVLYNLEGHSSLVGLLDLQAERLISAAADSTLRIWDPENGQCKNTLTAHTGAITCFQHDNSKVISGSDRTLKMWNVQTGECLKDLLTNLSCVWQVRFNQRRCVAAVQRNRVTYIEVRLLLCP